MTERSSEATSSRFTYDEPVSATKHDAATPDSPFGANRQVNGWYTSYTVSIPISDAECQTLR